MKFLGAKCEGNYIQPTFITDYPKEMSPLCKQHRDNPELTEQYKVRSVPTLVFFKNNEMKATTVGAISKEKLMSIIDKLKEE